MTETALHPAPSTPTPIASREEAIAFAEQLHGLLDAMTSHLQRETTALKAGTLTSEQIDHETKSALLFDYRAALARLRDNKDVVSRFAPVKIDELRRVNEVFQGELQKNLASITTAKAISEHLLNRLADHASANRQPKTYGAAGTMTRPAKPAALSVDRAL